MSPNDRPPARISLGPQELALLRFTCDLSSEEESPLGRQAPIQSHDDLDATATALAARGLLDRKTLRPNRDLLRRLLVVSQPDARIVLTEVQGARRQRVHDYYERAGAVVAHRREGDRHELGTIVELKSVEDEIGAAFSVRRSTGDFVDLTLSTAEYLAFSLLARDFADRHRTAFGAKAADMPTERTSLEPVSGDFDLEEGTPIRVMLQRLTKSAPAVESEPELERALAGLIAKNVVLKVNERHALRPYLHDLARGLADRRRKVIARFDFGESDWLARDATFIQVPGSIFLIRATPPKSLRILELDGRTLQSAIHSVVGPMK